MFRLHRLTTELHENEEGQIPSSREEPAEAVVEARPRVQHETPRERPKRLQTCKSSVQTSLRSFRGNFSQRSPLESSLTPVLFWLSFLHGRRLAPWAPGNYKPGHRRERPARKSIIGRAPETTELKRILGRSNHATVGPGNERRSRQFLWERWKKSQRVRGKREQGRRSRQGARRPESPTGPTDRRLRLEHPTGASYRGSRATPQKTPFSAAAATAYNTGWYAMGKIAR